jgi:predicted SprT family Zn-dependent metalloprotease
MTRKISSLPKRLGTREVTAAQYQALQDAYNLLNEQLFDGSLPQVMVTLQRHSRAHGYFAPERFRGRVLPHAVVHELALNPDTFIGRTDREVLSTLAHEMAHVWQQVHGKPPRRAYHDRQWAAKMKEIGLQPSHTGAAGGKETGQTMSHYILPGALFDKAYKRLAGQGFRLDWQSAPRREEVRNKRASKTKFTCPACGLNAWAKPDADLLCGNDEHEGEAIEMLAEVDEQ